jgi:ferrous iron transport protein B
MAATPDKPASAVAASKPVSSQVVLTGNPNCGKTTLFNALTGLRARVGNYAGVTVERKEGRMLHTPSGTRITLLDLPGTYSLSPQSIDEQISRDVLFHRLKEVPPPDLVVIVVDASNLERNLYYATQVIELGYPAIVALNMIDVAGNNGHQIDAGQLSAALGVPVFPIVASGGDGLPALRKKIADMVLGGTKRVLPRTFCELPFAYGSEIKEIAARIEKLFQQRPTSSEAEALLLLTDDRTFNSQAERYPESIREAVAEARQRLEQAGEDWRSKAIEARYARIGAIQQAVTTEAFKNRETFSDKLDRLLTHRIMGVLIFTLVMAVMFECIFTFAKYPMHWLEGGIRLLGEFTGRAIPPGDLHSLVVDGVIAGVGAVVVFLPQILMLFLFIGLLEDTGYMARAAFLMDRLMSRVGLHGKSFIPMLSSFACAIPGIMATRTIETPKDRLATILVAPLMSCSARLPVYTLLIAACIPDRKAFGIFKLQGITMLAMYLLGIIVALFMAWLFKRTLLRGEPPLLIMELPPYKMPVLKVVLRHMWDRSRLFLRRAGTVILGISILLWFLATYPRHAGVEREFASKRQTLETAAAGTPSSDPAAREAVQRRLSELETEQAGEKLRQSFAGYMGRAIEPVIAPLGFDWKIGVGIISSFAAREVFVSTMSTVYNVGSSGEDVRSTAETLRAQKRPDGSIVYTPLTAVTLMVFYVFALQCVSTVAVVRRETNSWKWPAFQWAYMGALAWVLAFATRHGGQFLGF